MKINGRYLSIFHAALILPTLGAAGMQAQEATNTAAPIAIVPLKTPEAGHENEAVSVTGALEVSAGKAVIAVSGAITSGSKTTDVVLPHRGVLRICAATTVKLAADRSIPATPGQTPGLMMALDHGAVEASFATGRNADILLTPDFRILISGPGAADVKVRLGQHGDTCVDNAGLQAPYVLVSSVFEDGAYHVQPGQRVMFQHGSLHEVVDKEKEPCGCPPSETHGNEFPLAQSEGLAPLATPAPAAVNAPVSNAETSTTLVYNAAEHAPPPVAAEPAAAAPAATPAAAKKPGFMAKVGRFFRRIFGAEQ
jgi:hypothetical protein